MRFRQWTAGALVLAVMVIATGCSGSSGQGRSARTALEEFTSQHPGAPVVVPVRWSEDWDWFEPDMWQSDNGRVTEVHYRITPVAREEQPRIGLCIAPGAADAPAETTADQQESSPCNLPDGQVSRTVDGLETTIYAYGNEPPPDVWSNIELTTNWQSVDWLDDVPGGCCP